ncbi:MULTISPECIES: RidA family protein [Enterobacteriaceae]|uniref:RidA family protein n=1 Tax=Enterobacteriaceae TaxID=543 RepID=UPI0019172768|nr:MULTISPECIES: RidA family protein [Enterobacteriaceae]EDL4059703.1 regulator [Salmonella enterica subsp. enterica serovar Infantis]EEK3070252.1 RidA family protein [Salmonella enterica subsp. diarizonae serovar 38:[k]:z35:-]EHQ4034170.1 RidA family protein [Salmonella enterica]HDX1606429.1 RidA family protein [Escherichia coli]HEQ3490055.1 RidA family protein [Raoultella ornithinolytica]
MKKQISTEQAPAAIGPYSQAIQLGDMIFTSGQLPLDPVTMAFPKGGIKEQTIQSLKNIQSILEKSGSSMSNVVKTTCFLADMAHFAEFNQVYEEFFGTECAPARSCVQAAKLPKDALVEVEVIAFTTKAS